MTMSGYGQGVPDRIRIAVVYGGRSSEHAISCVSAGSILRALDPQRYDVIPIGIAQDGRWVLEGADSTRLQIRDRQLPAVDSSGVEVGDVRRRLADVDVVFPVLHGPWGEDGTIQGLLELAGVPYVGSGVLASAACMDKITMKSLMVAAGLPVDRWVAITDRLWRDERERVLADIEALGRPIFVKPSRAGSSVGITKVPTGGDVIAAIEEARRHDPRVIVEPSVEGAREIECGVLVDRDAIPRASTCAEIRVREGHEFYDFTAKYLDDSVDLIVPADLDAEVAAQVQLVAVRAFEVLGCEGLARVDFFVAPDRVVINEVNTMPGFTSVSMYPRMWAASGLDYPALVDQLVADAIRRGTGLR